MMSVNLDEEEKGLLRKILRAQAYRQMMASNIRGHGLKFLRDPEGRIGLVGDLQHNVNQVSRVQELYTAIGGGDIRHEASVKMERIPYPSSRFELATFLATSDVAEEIAMQGYLGCKWKELAQIASDDLAYERTATRRSRVLFQEFAADPEQRPFVRQVLTRWLVIALLSLGRPGTAADRRTIELKLRTRTCAESIALYFERMAPLIETSGLDLDDIRAAGVELPV